MGDAKRRKAEIEKLKNRVQAWRNDLKGDSKVVAEAAIYAFENIVIPRKMFAGCYHLAFFLREYLAREKAVGVEMIVGWITDESWEGATSHAWIEHEGKKTDISLWLTERPEIQLRGSVLINEFEFLKGLVTHVYHKDFPESAKPFLQTISENAELKSVIEQKANEHLQIKKLSEESAGADDYFRGAPASMKYEALLKGMVGSHCK